MSHDTSHTESRDRGTDSTAGVAGRASRRTFLKATAAGAVAGGLTATTVGTVAGDGIPTPFLQRDGNKIKDPSGNDVILRGVNIADPRRINETASARGKNTEQVIEYATGGTEGWYARVIRLPVHPGDIAGLPPVPEADVDVHEPPTFTQAELQEYCEKHLDDAVDKCEEVGAYAIVDYHRHWGEGSLQWDNTELAEEVHMFWELVADRYADRDHVIYEMYNEPTRPGIGASPAKNEWEADRWREWRSHAQQWVDTIRDQADNLVLCGSPDWSQYPEGALVEEFEGGNIGYTYHIYPGHSVSEDGQWDEHDNGEGVEYCWEEVPLFVTEFGWQEGIAAYPTIGTTSGFGEPFFDWMDDKPIHWTAWCLDPTWLSSAVERQFETSDSTEDSIGDPYTGDIPEYCEDLPCEWEPRPDPHMGVYTQQVLAEKRNDDVPGGDPGPTEPTSPNDQWVNETTMTSIQIGWSEVEDATEYNVYLDDQLETTTSDEVVTITGLAPDTDYEIGLESVNDVGTSSTKTTTVTTDSDGDEACADAADSETLDDGRTVCDVDGDGNYMDVTGDGSVTNSDVTEFFGNQHVDPWDSRTDLFDFDGDDEVSQADVVALFDNLVS